jgi:hypothetical protein
VSDTLPEEWAAKVRGPAVYLFGLMDGMRKISAPREEEWRRLQRCIREVCDELAALMPENTPPEPHDAEGELIL